MNAKTLCILPNIVDLLLDAVFMVDVQGRIVYVSAACERIFGYAPDEMIGKFVIDLVAPEDRAKTREEAVHVMAGLPRIGFENRYVRKDGRLVHIMWSARWTESDQLRIGVARDITALKRAEDMQTATYAISEAAHATTDLVALFRDIHQIIAKRVSAPGFAVAMLDVQTRTLTFPYQADLSGNTPVKQVSLMRRLFSEVERRRLPILLPDARLDTPSPDDASPVAQESWMAAPLTNRKEVFGALILKSSPGTIYAESDKELLQFVSTQVATAIERTRLNAELLHAARYDDLTGLPNRRLFHDRMKSALARARRNDKRIALLYIDINDFKLVNDTLGHAAGDRLLQEVARRLQQCVREEDTVARLGGDEFAVLLEGIHSLEAPPLVADKIRFTINHPIDIDGHVLRIRSSIGIALYPDHGHAEEQLLMYADEAMYKAKKAKIAAAD